MSNDLATLQDGNYSIDILDQLSKSGDYFSRIQLVGSNSQYAKKKIVESGNYALISSKDAVTDLGRNFEIIPFVFRPLAMDTSGEQLIFNSDINSATFKSIQNRSDTKDSGCMWGANYLCWLPKPESYATFFCGTKTLRRFSGTFKNYMKVGCLLDSEVIEKGKYIWEGPVARAVAVPLTLPDNAADMAKKFFEAKDTGVELAPETAKDERR